MPQYAALPPPLLLLLLVLLQLAPLQHQHQQPQPRQPQPQLQLHQQQQQQQLQQQTVRPRLLSDDEAVPHELDGGLVAVLEQPAAFVQRLLHPIELSDFYHSGVWGRRPHHFSRSASLPHHNADLLPVEAGGSLQRFVGRCVSAVDDNRGGQLQERRDLTLVKRGTAPSEALLDRRQLAAASTDRRVLSPDMVGAALDAGYSMVLNWMQFRAPAVAQLAEAFESVFGHHTSVNLYHTPPQEQAFLLHYDETDVFVLQLAGEKRWTVHAQPAVPFARSEEATLESRQLAEAEGAAAAAEYTLRAGDLLYIPRGTPHSAASLAAEPGGGGGVEEGGSSSHLTVRCCPRL